MTFITQTCFLTIRQLLKNKTLVFIMSGVSLLLAALITWSIYFCYAPGITYFNSQTQQKAFVVQCAKLAEEGGIIFKNESDIYPTIKDGMEKGGIDRDIPELAKLSVENFLNVLLPPIFPKMATLLQSSRDTLLLLLMTVFALSWLPTFIGIFLIHAEENLLPLLKSRGIAVLEYTLGKILAGAVVSLLLTSLIILGVLVGLSFTAAGMNTITSQTSLLAQLALINFAGLFAATTFSFMLALMLPEIKSQVVISVLATPLIALALFFYAVKAPLIQNTTNALQSELSLIQTERIPIDKNEVDLMMERQVLNYAQMFAVKLGSDLLPRTVKSIPTSHNKLTPSIVANVVYSFSMLFLVCMVLSFGLSTIRFKKL